ncbi:YeiH family protein [Euzebya tangerina]|uniref:YeiH family protein n=1 Tax=Euzebya tangerina TaxID=591198 RepID=UPI00196B1706|nr:putative sulfate exporter family transporter [Euzebya tangerina]
MTSTADVVSDRPRSSVRPTGQKAPSSSLPGLLLVVGLAGLATVLAELSDSLSPLVVGVGLGALVSNTVALPQTTAPGIALASRRLLRIGIVLLGLRLSLSDLAELGPGGLGVVAVVVTVTFTGTRLLARRLGIPPDLGLLVATGYSICGASAIAAVNGVVRADEDESAYAIALVTLCGTLSIVVLPVLGGPMGFVGETFGTWVGGAVHDVGQVVATAAVAGDEAIAAATVVKLSRVVLLAPLVAAVALSRRRASSGRDEATVESASAQPLVPLFVVGFLAMIAVRTSSVLPVGVLEAAALAEKLLLTAALVALGMGVRVAMLRRLGGRPLVLGLAAWVLVAGTAAVGTAVVGV